MGEIKFVALLVAAALYEKSRIDILLMNGANATEAV